MEEADQGLLRAAEVAKMLNASTEAVYLLARQGTLPSVRWSKTVRFERQAVLEFIEKNRYGGEGR